MTRRWIRFTTAGCTVIVLATVSIATGLPLRWAKGVVLPSACASTEADYLRRVEVVPGGEQVEAASGLDLPAGTWVKIRIWHNVLSGREIYVGLGITG